MSRLLVHVGGDGGDQVPHRLAGGQLEHRQVHTPLRVQLVLQLHRQDRVHAQRRQRLVRLHALHAQHRRQVALHTLADRLTTLRRLQLQHLHDQRVRLHRRRRQRPLHGVENRVVPQLLQTRLEREHDDLVGSFTHILSTRLQRRVHEIALALRDDMQCAEDIVLADHLFAQRSVQNRPVARHSARVVHAAQVQNAAGQTLRTAVIHETLESHVAHTVVGLAQVAHHGADRAEHHEQVQRQLLRLAVRVHVPPCLRLRRQRHGDVLLTQRVDQTVAQHHRRVQHATQRRVRRSVAVQAPFQRRAVRRVHRRQLHVHAARRQPIQHQLVLLVHAARATRQQQVPRAVLHQPLAHAQAQPARAAHHQVRCVRAQQPVRREGQLAAGGKQRAVRLAQLNHHLADVLGGGQSAHRQTQVLQRVHFRWWRLQRAVRDALCHALDPAHAHVALGKVAVHVEEDVGAVVQERVHAHRVALHGVRLADLDEGPEGRQAAQALLHEAARQAVQHKIAAALLRRRHHARHEVAGAAVQHHVRAQRPHVLLLLLVRHRRDHRRTRRVRQLDCAGPHAARRAVDQHRLPLLHLSQ